MAIDSPSRHADDSEVETRRRRVRVPGTLDFFAAVFANFLCLEFVTECATTDAMAVDTAVTSAENVTISNEHI